MRYERQTKEHEKAVKLYLEIQAYTFEHAQLSRAEISHHFKVSTETVRKALSYIPAKKVS